MPDQFVERRVKRKAGVASILAFLLLLAVAMVVLAGCGIPKKKFSDGINLAYTLGKAEGWSSAIKVYESTRGCAGMNQPNPYHGELEKLLQQGQ